MSIVIPEQPHLLYPSHIQAVGIEGALLLSLCHTLLAASTDAPLGQRRVVITATQWQKQIPYWTSARLNELVEILAQHGALMVRIHSDGSVTLTDYVDAVVPVTSHQAQTPPMTHRVETLPVMDTPPPSPRTLPSHNPVRERGPAPAFGGSLGWNRQKDELQQLFDRHEERNQQLHKMELNWRPSDMFFSMLPRHQIPAAFAENCIDEFTLFYIDKDRRESNWDQKFLAWVKREWVKQQSREAREKQQDSSSYAGQQHENTRRDTREKRKRVTAAIMDIKDTDW